MFQTIITPKKDLVFKRIFGMKGNEGILQDFLESILDFKIDSVSFDLPTELLPKFQQGKESRVDVRAKLQDGSQVNVEMQIDVREFNDGRCLTYWSDLYTSFIVKGDPYSKLKKTICIWLLDGTYFHDFQKYHSTWKITETELGFIGHFEDLEFHIIELPKFRKADIIKPKKKEFWLWFIDHINEEGIKMACLNNKKIEEARQTLEEIYADKELMDEIRRRDIFEHDVATGLENAKKEGVEIRFETRFRTTVWSNGLEQRFGATV